MPEKDRRNTKRGSGGPAGWQRQGCHNLHTMANCVDTTRSSLSPRELLCASQRSHSAVQRGSRPSPAPGSRPCVSAPHWRSWPARAPRARASPAAACRRRRPPARCGGRGSAAALHPQAARPAVFAFPGHMTTLLDPGAWTACAQGLWAGKAHQTEHGLHPPPATTQELLPTWKSTR